MTNEAETVDDSTGEAAVSMEDALGAALDGLGASTNDEGTPPAEVEASTVDPDEIEDGSDEAKAARERDEQGRFKTKADKEAGEEAGEEGKAAEGEQLEGEQQEAVLVDGKDITKPPGSWKPESAAEFAKLPETVRKEVHKREEDFHRGIEQYRGAAQFGQDIAKEFQPYQQMLEATKVAPSQLVNAALQFEYQIRTGTAEQKVALLHNLAKAYGVALDGAPEDDGEPPDPRFVSLLEEVNGLKSKLTEREQQEQREREQAEQTERNRIRSEVSAFSADPKNEFYGLVKDDMVKLIQSGQGADLRDAYDKAIWINPVTREKLIARQRETERAKAAERAAAAKKANLANVAPRATPPGKASGKGTMEEALGSAVDAALASGA